MLNIVATYGRSLYALVCGLFISRWMLAALGKSELGLDGMVGGMAGMAALTFAMRMVCGGSAAVALTVVNPKVKICAQTIGSL